MIPETTTQVESIESISVIPSVESWRHELADAFRRPAELLAHLGFSATAIDNMTCSDQGFSTLVPRSYAARMERSNPQDPLLLQVLPQIAEAVNTEGYHKDPLAEQAYNPVPGIVHKYDGRVLLLVTGHCAINCRFCFRRHFPYHDNRRSRLQWQQSLAYVRDDPSIHEVILSGGDPLAATDSQLTDLLQQLAAIPQLKRVRIHTRLPIILPSRVTVDFCKVLRQLPLQVIIVTHANHASELDHSVYRACQMLRQHGIHLLNQSVLLRGINDRRQTLVQLSERLFACDILPYYLHLLDRVQGTAHFYVDDTKARDLLAGLQGCLPGYLVPRLVREEAGEPGKTMITSSS